jgi:hypothetical protein
MIAPIMPARTDELHCPLTVPDQVRKIIGRTCVGRPMTCLMVPRIFAICAMRFLLAAEHGSFRPAADALETLWRQLQVIWRILQFPLQCGQIK